MARQARKNTNLVENVKEINQWYYTLQEELDGFLFGKIFIIFGKKNNNKVVEYRKYLNIMCDLIM